MRTRITLACTECKQRNYNMTKDKKTHPERMETKKYCRFCKKHTNHKETKYAGCERISDYMSEKEKKEKAPKKSWFDGLKAEFRKIIWPDQKSIGKQTAAVLSVSVVLGVLITIIDMIVQYGVDFLVK